MNKTCTKLVLFTRLYRDAGSTEHNSYQCCWPFKDEN